MHGVARRVAADGNGVVRVQRQHAGDGILGVVSTPASLFTVISYRV